MTARHLVLLVEELSMEAFLRALLPRLLPPDRTFEVHSFQGKGDLLKKLQDRLRAYSKWLPSDARIVVVVDRDDDDCQRLKARLEAAAASAKLVTRSRSKQAWQLVNRIAVEELEAWYFGDWAAVCRAYPRVPATVPRQAGYRNPDAIQGGTWEAFERVLKRHGYFKTGLPKVQVARTIGSQIAPLQNQSSSFVAFRDAILEASA